MKATTIEVISQLVPPPQGSAESLASTVSGSGRITPSRLLAWILVGIAALGLLLQGCITYRDDSQKHAGGTGGETGTRVDFADSLLNRRQIFLFGSIDQRIAELTIQKLIYLDGLSALPIDLYLQTPGGEIKHAMAIERTMRLLKAPVNTYGLYECNSGGALLLTAGTGKRRAFEDAVIVLHGIVFHGKPPRVIEQPVQDSYSTFWRKRARLPESWIPLPFGSLHVLTAKQALEYGIIDEIIAK